MSATTVTVKKTVLGILAIVILFIGIVASFPHRVFPDKNPESSSITIERNLLKDNWVLKENNLDKLLLDRLISIEDYKTQKDLNEANRINDFKGISKKRRVSNLEFSFNGRTSKNYWFWIFGSFLTLLICSCYLAVKDARLKKAGELLWYEPHAAIGFINVSLFWLYHTIFKVYRDFDLVTYGVVLFLLLLPVSYFIYHFIRRLFVVDKKLINNIRNLVGFVLNNTKKESEEEMWNVLDKVSENGK